MQSKTLKEKVQPWTEVVLHLCWIAIVVAITVDVILWIAQ